MAKKIYAKAPDVVQVHYITPGKLYEVIKDRGGCFEIIDDNGVKDDPRWCNWQVCAHLGGGNWQRIEINEDAPVMSATRQTVLAALEGALPASVAAHESDPVVIPAHIVLDAIALLREGV